MSSPFHNSAAIGEIHRTVEEAIGYRNGGAAVGLDHSFMRLSDVARFALAWEALEMMIAQRSGYVAIVDSRQPIDSVMAKWLTGLIANSAGEDEPPASSPAVKSEPAKRDRVKVADNIFRRGDRFQVIWQADGRQQQQAVGTQAEALAFREQLVASGQVKPLPTEQQQED